MLRPPLISSLVSRSPSSLIVRCTSNADAAVTPKPTESPAFNASSHAAIAVSGTRSKIGIFCMNVGASSCAASSGVATL